MQMRCQWQEVLRVIPPWMRDDVDKLGKNRLQELRLRLGQKPELRMGQSNVFLDRIVSREDIHYVVNIGSQYSPWAAATMGKGYLTIRGGHRIGLCGDAVIHDGNMTGIREVTGLCIRVARDFPGIAAGAKALKGSVLILGPPGSGKTTLLRDLIRQRSNSGNGCVAVVDEREELFPSNMNVKTGLLDVLPAYEKSAGIQQATRLFSPQVILCDEIGSSEEAQAVLNACSGGCTVIASAHAATLSEAKRTPALARLLESGKFRYAVFLEKLPGETYQSRFRWEKLQ
jgi:stage III sporulation protein AA